VLSTRRGIKPFKIIDITGPGGDAETPQPPPFPEYASEFKFKF